MPYAVPSDMITRFGVAEMIRLTTPQDQDMTTVNVAPVTLALGDASDLIDGYVGKRYTTPLNPVTSSINRAACDLARFDLSSGDGRTPSEDVTNRRKETIRWLESIAAGRVILPAEAAGDDSFAMMSDRGAVFGPGQDANVFPAVNPYPQSDQGGPSLADIVPGPGAGLGGGWGDEP